MPLPPKPPVAVDVSKPLVQHVDPSGYTNQWEVDVRSRWAFKNFSFWMGRLRYWTAKRLRGPVEADWAQLAARSVRRGFESIRREREGPWSDDEESYGDDDAAGP